MTESITQRAGGRKSFNSLTYSDVATQLGLGLCTGGCRMLTAAQHRDGRVVPGPLGVMHWSERRPTRRGLRHFLMLASIALDPAIEDSADMGHRLYLMNVTAQRLGQQFGLRFRREWASKDRAMVRKWLYVDGSTLTHAERKRVYEWAKD